MTKLEKLKKDIENAEDAFVGSDPNVDLVAFFGQVLSRLDKMQQGKFPILVDLNTNESWFGEGGFKLPLRKPCELTRAYPTFPDELPDISYWVTAIDWYKEAPVQELFLEIQIKRNSEKITVPVSVEAFNEYVLFDVIDSLEDKVQHLIELYPTL